MTRAEQHRILLLQERLRGEGIDLYLTDDPDSICYFTGYWGYLGMDFGRPTFLVVPQADEPILVTPAIEAEMARTLTGVSRILAWTDGVGGEWRDPLLKLLGRTPGVVGIEAGRLHPVLARAMHPCLAHAPRDVAPILAALRMIKTPAEIAVMRQAGQVALAMVEAARLAIAPGVPEYEVALAVIHAGTRQAAEFLKGETAVRCASPMIANLQIMQSGPDTAMVHARPSVRPIAEGDAVYLCFCGIANFRHMKLGFDREFFIGRSSQAQERCYEVALKAQQTALAMVRPGAIAQEIHLAAQEVYRSAGFGFSYRTGRGIGYSFLEKPELKAGDTTRLAEGMTLAIDGGITIPGELGARVGDSIVVTPGGFEFLTPYPREFTIL